MKGTLAEAQNTNLVRGAGGEVGSTHHDPPPSGDISQGPSYITKTSWRETKKDGPFLISKQVGKNSQKRGDGTSGFQKKDPFC